MLITAFNPSLEELEKTYLSIAESAGTTDHQVKNASNFVADDRVQIGEPGREKTEIVTVVSVTDTEIVTGATLYPHDANSPVYRLRFDQVKFYRSTDGIDGTYSELTAIAIDVDQAELTTVYDDTSGISSYYYKVSYYNSVSTLESSLSDPIPGSGYDRGTVGYFIDQFLTEVGDRKQEFVTRDEIIGWIGDVGDDLLLGVTTPFDWLKTRAAFTRTASQNYLNYPTDSTTGEITMWKLDRIRHYNSDTEKWETLTEKSIDRFEILYDDESADESDEIKHFAMDEATDKIRLGPTPATTQTAAFYIYYWEKFNTIDSEGDRFQTPNQKIYKDYCLMKFYRKKQIQDTSFKPTADGHEKDYIATKFRLKSQNRRSQGTPRSFAPPSSIHDRHKGNRSYD